VIYKINRDLKVARVTEGLAPGPLQPLSGDYLDSHSLGQAADFDIEIPKDKRNPDDIRKIAMKNGMNGFVTYDAFFHMDGRTGLAAFIDMRGVKLQSGKKDCSSFEFSRIKQIAAGHLREDPSKNYLAAWVGDEIYVYLISGISDDGILDKERWVIKAPKGFKGFENGQALTYKTETGTSTLTLR
jgi:hypothetical protein